MKTHAHLTKALEYAVDAAKTTRHEYQVWFDHDDQAWSYAQENKFCERLRIVVKPNGECVPRIGQVDVI